MKIPEAVALGGCLTSLATAALTLEKKATPNVVSFPIQHRVTPHGHHKRAPGALRVPLLNERYYTHNVNLTLGTPPQQLMALLDTGSSGFMVYGSNSDKCKTGDNVCKMWGSCEYFVRSFFSIR